ncbi:GUN4 domain-containing protein [Anabaena cylindrica UHCC 0172]|uniref:GUN4 domain-containing protein n=1 Tax=Anabaena cylindrica TaxID=1165 RepID=UPI002B1F65BE|nr:GUN4 domain-containing protein [Anabaena cylindrica]MEA5553045.1 GUN4 domain-containing protein [Anabaena cylindrica UHCC 0172]
MAGELLDIYQKIYQQGEVISQNTGEEGKLQLSGLVVKINNYLQIYNPIYREVFNQEWIDNQLAALRPYSEAFRAWYGSGCHENSWLLRGNALKIAEEWAELKNLSFQDKQFLAASRQQEIEEEINKREKESELERERKEKEAAERARIIEEEAKQEAEKQLAKARRRVYFAQVFLLIAGVLGIAIAKVALDASSNLKNVAIQLENTKKLTKNEQQKAENATQQVIQKNTELSQVNDQMKQQQREAEKAKTEAKNAKIEARTAKEDKEKLETQKNRLDNDTKKLQGELQSKSQKIKDAENKVLVFKQQQEKITNRLKDKQRQFNIAKEQTEKSQKDAAQIRQSIDKITELSAVASQLQQKNQVNEANQFLNIAGLVLQEKITNQELKEALLDSSLVLGYESLKTEENKNPQLESQYNKAKEDLNESFKKLPKENNIDKNDSSYLATLVYIYYVKGKLGKSLNNYKIALAKYDILKSQLKSNTDLFKLDLNILYNGNADIVASLYRQLDDLDKSNTVYYESLKTHLLNELDYLMKQNRWKDADLKNWQFILVSAKREKEGYLEVNDVKNFQCQDLKAVDKLWVDNSKGKFGYSVQKRIYLETGNSLDFDWKKGTFTKWNEEGYNTFVERVGWKKGKEEGGDWMRYDELPLWEEKYLSTYKKRFTLPYLDGGGVVVTLVGYLVWGWVVGGGVGGFFSLLAETCRL